MLYLVLVGVFDMLLQYFFFFFCYFCVAVYYCCRYSIVVTFDIVAKTHAILFIALPWIYAMLCFYYYHFNKLICLLMFCFRFFGIYKQFFRGNSAEVKWNGMAWNENSANSATIITKNSNQKEARYSTWFTCHNFNTSQCFAYKFVSQSSYSSENTLLSVSLIEN